MRFHWLLLGSLSVILLSSPAKAGRFISWQFESSQKQSVLTTEKGIQAKGQLISITAAKQTESTTNFQITSNGLFIRLDSDGDNSKIKIKRSRDRKTIKFTLENATLPSSLVSQSLPVNSYGIKDIQFAQTSSSNAQITLNVGEDSPDWQAIYSRFGGLVLLPQGGVSSLEGRNRISQLSSEEKNDESDSEIVTIESLELNSNNTQLLIKGDRDVNANGNWNSREGVYEIRIPNAKLPDSFPDLQLDRNSPIYEVRLREEDNQTVVILIKPSLGVQFGNLNRSNDEVFALEIQSFNNRETALSPVPIYVPPPETSTPSMPPETLPSSPISSVPQGQVTVIIDPGHGGKDPGAIGIGGLRETDVILSISQEVAGILKQQGVRVMMTRNSDYFVSLQGRTDMANRAGADLFVSIHANSMGQGRPDVSGLEVYYFGNQALASTIQKSILQTVNIKDRGVRRARFYVLRKSAMPATLVEVGFVTGSQDSANLKNSTYRRQMAEAIARGTLEYIQQNKL